MPSSQRFNKRKKHQKTELLLSMSSQFTKEKEIHKTEKTTQALAFCKSILGKVFTKIIQNRMNSMLREHLEKNKPDSGQEEIQSINNSQQDRYSKKNRTQPENLHQFHRLQTSIPQHMYGMMECVVRKQKNQKEQK